MCEGRKEIPIAAVIYDCLKTRNSEDLRAVPTLNGDCYNRSVPNFVMLEWSSSSGTVFIRSWKGPENEEKTMKWRKPQRVFASIFLKF